MIENLRNCSKSCEWIKSAASSMHVDTSLWKNLIDSRRNTNFGTFLVSKIRETATAMRKLRFGAWHEKKFFSKISTNCKWTYLEFNCQGCKEHRWMDNRCHQGFRTVAKKKLSHLPFLPKSHSQKKENPRWLQFLHYYLVVIFWFILSECFEIKWSRW